MTISSQRDNTGQSLMALVLVVFVAMTGFGIFIPIFPFIGLTLDATPTAIALAVGAYSVGQLIAAPLWGRLSDRIGRKPVLIIGLLGACASYLLILWAETILQMGLARLFGGLMAGNIGAAFAAAADLADEKTRARNMGFLGAAFGFGFIVGPALAGFAIGNEPTWADFQRLCLYAAGFAGLAALTALFVFRETAPLGQERHEPAHRLALLRARPFLTQLVIGMVLMITAQAMMETIFAIWADQRIGWGVRQVAFLMASLGLVTALLQGGAAGRLCLRFGEPRVLTAGLTLFIAGFLALGLAASKPLALTGLGLLAIGAGLAMPALQSLIAAQAGPGERGAIMGLSQSASALGRAIGAVAVGPLYDGLGPGAPFFVGAVLLAMAMAPALRAPQLVKP
jgi:MFS transporter, DHA1 family, tetracycline resistance protein